MAPATANVHAATNKKPTANPWFHIPNKQLPAQDAASTKPHIKPSADSWEDFKTQHPGGHDQETLGPLPPPHQSPTDKKDPHQGDTVRDTQDEKVPMNDLSSHLADCLAVDFPGLAAIAPKVALAFEVVPQAAADGNIASLNKIPLRLPVTPNMTGGSSTPSTITTHTGQSLQGPDPAATPSPLTTTSPQP